MGGPLNVSRETRDKLVLLKEILSKWNHTLNLVSPTTIAQIDTRHIDDSAQILRYAPINAQHWLDIGSGGGLPGLVVAAFLSESSPHCRITLVESDKRKCVFLREAARHMNVTVDVLADRIEALAPLGADVISARAVASLTTLCFYAQQHLKSGGTALLLKGANYQSEVQAAQSDGWCFDLLVHKSVTDPSGAILELRNLRNEHA